MRTFITTIICSVILFRYDKTLSCFCFIVSLMQLAEYFIWSDQSCGNMNHYGSMFAFFILLLQPISLWVLSYIFNESELSQKTHKNIIIIYFIFFCYWIYILYKFNGKLCSKPGKFDHIIWDINPLLNSAPYIIVIIFWILYLGTIVPLLKLKNKFLSLIYFIIGLITLGFSLYINLYGSSWKSYWCYVVNMIPVILVIVVIIKSLYIKNHIKLNL